MFYGLTLIDPKIYIWHTNEIGRGDSTTVLRMVGVDNTFLTYRQRSSCLARNVFDVSCWRLSKLPRGILEALYWRLNRHRRSILSILRRHLSRLPVGRLVDLYRGFSRLSRDIITNENPSMISVPRPVTSWICCSSEPGLYSIRAQSGSMLQFTSRSRGVRRSSGNSDDSLSAIILLPPQHSAVFNEAL